MIMPMKHISLQTNGEIQGTSFIRWLYQRISIMCRIKYRRIKNEKGGTKENGYLRYVNKPELVFSVYTSGSLFRRNERDNPGQTEPRLWGKSCWKMRRCTWLGGGSGCACVAVSFRKSVSISMLSAFDIWRWTVDIKREYKELRWVQGRLKTGRPWTSWYMCLKKSFILNLRSWLENFFVEWWY